MDNRSNHSLNRRVLSSVREGYICDRSSPASDDIVAFLAYSGVGPSGTYRLPHINGFFPREGLYTKTFWTIDNSRASSDFLIDGTNLSDVRQVFHDTGNAVSGPGPITGINVHTYTSYLQAPSTGCWRLQITSGQARGIITMWFYRMREVIKQS